jgi:cytochrome c
MLVLLRPLIWLAVASLSFPVSPPTLPALSPTPPTKPRVLVFSRTKGFVHSSIPFGIAAIQKLGKANGFDVDTTKNAAYFVDDSLKKYAAVIFNCTTGNVLDPEQQAAFERYIQAGGGYVGIHSAADTEYEWPWYNKLMGAYFASHPNNPNVRKATVDVLDKTHPSTRHLPDRWERTDEWYNYRSFYTGLKVLANLDENSYEGGTNGSNHPIAWYHEFDGGRAFYTGGGHVDSSYDEPLFLEHLLGGIRYAMGPGKPLDYAKAYAKATPEENRFVKTVLVNDLNSPMELAVAPDGRVFFSELNGTLSVYDIRTGRSGVVHKFAVASKGGTGLIGVTLDPKFAQNRFIYLYYTPPKDEEPILFRLARFVVRADNTLDLASEKVLLTVPVELNSGAHHGGSLAWDKDGNLYLSTGDSTSPFPSNGYAPLDERPGRDYFSLDAQRSAGNTNDLKGKILRIHPQPDGSYTIPEGNLFSPPTPKGGAKGWSATNPPPSGDGGLTRPEIYAMGCRNPYRIAVNPRTGTVYWGEIGPDAGQDSLRGPRGYDEFNQAKTAGNFGWPYFVGNNYAYADWDFATKTAGPRYDPAKPVNRSPNNTGLQTLPPAQPAMIWYPYAPSPEFPELGQGGRSAMAGQFCQYNEKTVGKTGFPAYYDGALFVFDWMRNWVITLRFDEKENYVRNEPFMAANGDFRRPIDLAFSNDGVMYLLEYGSVYGADNEDARLVKIEYNRGNRPPVVRATVVDSARMAQARSRAYLTSDGRNVPPVREATGLAPLRVRFSARGTDPDEDALRYEWLFDGKTVGARQASASYTYTQPGTYPAVIRVTDAAGNVGTDTLMVRVGNARPDVRITAANTSFFWENKPFRYTVNVTDPGAAKVDPKKIRVFYAYNPQPGTLDRAPVGDQVVEAMETGSLGKTLVGNSDCKACHTVDKPSVGPTFLAVAGRYKGQAGAVEKLAKKIIAGGGGNWGTQHVMSAHPQVSEADAREMVAYIFSLTDPKKAPVSLPAEGTLSLNDHKPNEPRGQYTLVAAYTDDGGTGVGPLTGTDVVTLRPAKVQAVDTDAQEGFARFGNRLSAGKHKSYVMMKAVDLTGIRAVAFGYGAKDKAGEIEVRLDSQAGPVIARAPFGPTGDKPGEVAATLTQPVTGRHDVYFVVVKRDKPNDSVAALHTIEFRTE